MKTNRKYKNKSTENKNMKTFCGCLNKINGSVILI